MKIQAKLLLYNHEIKSRREALGYTQQQLADIVGIHQNLYSRIELMKFKPDEMLASRLTVA